MSNRNELYFNYQLEQFLSREDEGLIFYDNAQNELLYTEGFLKIFDMTEKDYELKDFFDSFHSKINRENNQNLLLKNNFFKYNKFIDIIKLNDGREIEFLYEKFNVTGASNNAVYTFRPVKKQETEALEGDRLTGLATREALLSQLENLVKNYKTNKHDHFSVLLININDFKVVNNLFGYKMGDFVLKQVANRLNSLIRDYDVLGRLNGDEFIILLRHFKTVESIKYIVDRILQKMEQPIRLLNRTYKITASIGISNMNQDVKSASELLKTASIALHNAQRLGKNTYCFYENKMDRVFLKEYEIEYELREAIRNNDFLVYYQPLIDYKNMRAFGVEALIRWKHPQKGIISPIVFITIAEKTGLILDIGKLTLKKAYEDIKKLNEEFNLMLAVNISPKQFKSDDFIDMIKKPCEEESCSCCCLEVELTENVAMENTTTTINNMKQLKEMSVSLAIDDFGTGYSSLAYLKRFPIDKIKIDRSFVRNIEHDQDDKAIVKAIISISQDLGLDILAEGVETAEQLRIINELGCHKFQGYLFDRPIPFEELFENLRSGKYSDQLNKLKDKLN
jgi:diguanylate cyclase (GGDEF)-like protein